MGEGGLQLTKKDKDFLAISSIKRCFIKIYQIIEDLIIPLIMIKFSGFTDRLRKMKGKKLLID